MLKEVKCNLCGSSKYKVLHNPIRSPRKDSKYLIEEGSFKVPERIVSCIGCGLIYVNPRRSPKELLSLYAHSINDNYIKEERGWRILARRILKKLEGVKRKGRLLDIGSSAGFLLDEAKKQGWEVYGIEVSRQCVDYSKKKFDLDIYYGSLKKAKFENSYFDAVILNNTLDRVTSPKETLVEIRRILKPDGVLCINTPNSNSLMSRILKAPWFTLNRGHLFYFTKDTLRKMLDVTGFSPVKFTVYPRTFTFKYWVFKFASYDNPLYKGLRYLVENTPLGRMQLTINMDDQLGVYAKKSRKLKYIEELEYVSQDMMKSRKLKTIVVLPAYNASKTLKKTIDDIPRSMVDDIILVDDKSTDNTVELAKKLGIKVFQHPRNRGYGANQKTCYQKAMELGADIVVMVHPDYQYDPKAIPNLVEPIKRGEADAVFGSRMMKGGALRGGMPLWKYNANIMLTAIENVIFGTYLTEYHSGFRAYSAKVLRSIEYTANSDGFVFDTEIIGQMLLHYFKIEEVPIKTRYFDEASMIKFWPSMVYGFGILKTLIKFMLHTHTFIKFKQFK